MVRSWLRGALLQPATGLIVAVATATLVVGVLMAGNGECSKGGTPGSWGAFSCNTAWAWTFLLPTFGGLIAAIFIALPFERGEDLLYRTRGVSLRRLRTSRLLSGCLIAALIMGLVSLITIMTSVGALPWRREALQPPGVIPAPDAPAPGLDPTLWAANPLVHDIGSVIPLMLAAAAFVVVGAVVGYLSGRALAAFLSPIAVVVAGQLLPPYGILGKINPYRWFDISPQGSMQEVMTGNALVAMIAYWIVWLVIGVFVIRLLPDRRTA